MQIIRYGLIFSLILASVFFTNVAFAQTPGSALCQKYYGDVVCDDTPANCGSAYKPGISIDTCGECSNGGYKCPNSPVVAPSPSPNLNPPNQISCPSGVAICPANQLANKLASNGNFFCLNPNNPSAFSIYTPTCVPTIQPPYGGIPGSCSNGFTNFCGGKSPTGCWCDQAATKLGDFCPDISSVCGYPAPVVTYPPITFPPYPSANAFCIPSSFNNGAFVCGGWSDVTTQLSVIDSVTNGFESLHNVVLSDAAPMTMLRISSAQQQIFYGRSSMTVCIKVYSDSNNNNNFNLVIFNQCFSPGIISFAVPYTGTPLLYTSTQGVVYVDRIGPPIPPIVPQPSPLPITFSCSFACVKMGYSTGYCANSQITCW